MQNRYKDKRKSQGCPMPLAYFSLEIIAISILLYMASMFHIESLILIGIFSAFAIFRLNKTSKVCARQKVYSCEQTSCPN